MRLAGKFSLLTRNRKVAKVCTLAYSFLPSFANPAAGSMVGTGQGKAKVF
jgi:hypothetical protein